MTAELQCADKAGVKEILAARKNKVPQATEEEIERPKSEPVPASITGIDVLDIEDAVKVLWKNNIYAEGGMGCTGPLVMMSENNREKSCELLKAAVYIE